MLYKDDQKLLQKHRQTIINALRKEKINSLKLGKLRYYAKRLNINNSKCSSQKTLRKKLHDLLTDISRKRSFSTMLQRQRNVLQDITNVKKQKLSKTKRKRSSKEEMDASSDEL